MRGKTFLFSRLLFHRCFGGTGGESFGFAIVDVRGGRAGVCSTGSVPSDPLDSVLERCWTSEDFFWLVFCGSSGSCCACGAGLGGFGGAISDVGVFGVINSSVSCVIDISTVARLCARDRTPEGRVFVGSGGGLPIGLSLQSLYD